MATVTTAQTNLPLHTLTIATNHAALSITMPPSRSTAAALAMTSRARWMLPVAQATLQSRAWRIRGREAAPVTRCLRAPVMMACAGCLCFAATLHLNSHPLFLAPSFLLFFRDVTAAIVVHKRGHLNMTNCIVVAGEQAGVICHGAGAFPAILVDSFLSRHMNYFTIALHFFTRAARDLLPGALVTASHCIIEHIGRSGVEAENGGVIELQHCVVQVVSTPRPDRLVLYLFSRHSFVGDLGWSGLRAALRRGRARRSCRVPRMQVPHPPPSCPARIPLHWYSSQLVPQLPQVRVQCSGVQPRQRSQGSRQPLRMHAHVTARAGGGMQLLLRKRRDLCENCFVRFDLCALCD
jgi:hypothetical protein